MEYKLAKELEGVGFWRKSFSMTHPFLDRQLTYEEKINVIHCTDISEFIEACGDGVGLYKEDSDSFYAWKTGLLDSSGGQAIHYVGKTPEEAVARLWLALNKKQ